MVTQPTEERTRTRVTRVLILLLFNGLGALAAARPPRRVNGRRFRNVMPINPITWP